MSPATEPEPQSTSSHMMKTTKRGRPFLKDTLDLFATLIVSLDLSPHKQFFRTFPHSFTTDEAAQNLASLKFSQSNRGPDPRDPSRVVTTTTTTTFSMTRDMAKAMSQHFMDARLIENAADPQSNLFKDRGVYQLTPKGLHVLERFISKNGINSDHLQPVFSSQPICIKLLHLERRSTDDEIIVTQSVITALFRRFVGRAPNYPPPPDKPLDAFQRYNERAKGISLIEVPERAQPLLGKSAQLHKHCFPAVSALEWLCDFTSVVGREEAAEMAAQFVRFGLITLVSDKRKNNDSAIIFTVRGSAPGGNSPVSQQGEFRCTTKAIYKITEEGKRLAHWDTSRPIGAQDSPNASQTTLTHDRSSVDGSVEGPDPKKIQDGSAKIHRRISLAEKLNANFDAADKKASSKESNSERLKYILEEPGLRSLFREFLRGNFCEENLSFWIDVQDFRKKFNITSSAMAAPSANRGIRNTPGQAVMERHHESLINTAFVIYNTYLAPSSQCELNIDHGLRNELVKYLEDVVTGLTGKAFQGRVEPEQANAFNATQLQTMIRLYERIQIHVFRLMATDSVPKFIKTPKFLAMRSWVDDFDGPDGDVQLLSSGGPSSPPGLSTAEEVGGAYITISQQASEREHRQQVAAAASATTVAAPPS
ncbi:regulator of G protein signaling domain-containing protein [Crepidotus variabilis]|uniref:Regulator of G protein signaling domain-containing protein n=1 Tax=Crepidotus variabilis TaxID=179855 RepID=A0A9P6EU09_9AGAR|nr:regulator of G protein signaling domain-containing protein [Crepidotus variabilis]